MSYSREKDEYWITVVFFAIFFVLTIAWVAADNALVSAVYGAISMGYLLKVIDLAKKFDFNGGN